MPINPFEGDGRVKVRPICPLPGTQSIAMTRAQARALIERFEKTGHSQHSGAGGTLWALLWHLHATQTPYRMAAHPGLGFYVEREEPFGE